MRSGSIFKPWPTAARWTKERRREGRGGWRENKKKEKGWSAIRRVQFDVGCDRARPSIRNSRRGNKSSRKTCELVRCHQLWSVVSRAEILRVIGGRGGDRVTRGIGVQRGDPVPRGFLLNGIKGTGLNLIGTGLKKKRRGMVIGSVAPIKRNSIEMASIS